MKMEMFTEFLTQCVNPNNLLYLLLLFLLGLFVHLLIYLFGGYYKDEPIIGNGKIFCFRWISKEGLRLSLSYIVIYMIFVACRMAQVSEISNQLSQM